MIEEHALGLLWSSNTLPLGSFSSESWQEEEIEMWSPNSQNVIATGVFWSVLWPLIISKRNILLIFNHESCHHNSSTGWSQWCRHQRMLTQVFAWQPKIAWYCYFAEIAWSCTYGMVLTIKGFCKWRLMRHWPWSWPTIIELIVMMVRMMITILGEKWDEFKANVVVLRLTMVMIRNTRSCILARLFVRRGSRFRSDCTLV